jgi:hypothetical protein
MNWYDRSGNTAKLAGAGTAPVFFEDIINSGVCKGRRGSPAQGYYNSSGKLKRESSNQEGR